MRKFPLPITNQAHLDFSLDRVRIENLNISELYRQAQIISRRINQKIDNPEQFITPGYLLGAYSLYLAKRDILAYADKTYDRLAGEVMESALTESNISDKELTEIILTIFGEDASDAENPAAHILSVLTLEKENSALIKKETFIVKAYALDHMEETAQLGKPSSALLSSLQNLAVPWESSETFYAYLTKPARLFPDDLNAQLGFILKKWTPYLSSSKQLLVRTTDFIREEEKPVFPPGPGPAHVLEFNQGDLEFEAFSQDSDWMPNVIMLAKSTLVWLDQLSKQYGYTIQRLDQIPDYELDLIAGRGFTALWLIGLWERSTASKRIKRDMGNDSAEASAYSLDSYHIADQLGGSEALTNLRHRCSERGIRLASDMVPNHTGIDSDWMMDRPDLFLSTDHSPYPSYSFNGPDLSKRDNICIQLEDHYYDQTDAAVVFRHIDHSSGQVRYIYHGNDGTSMPWNDTAQLNYLNQETREMVIQTILQVARNFPIIRFDAAMTLAKRHIQRLWFPRPGSGGDIPGRAQYAMDQQEFDMLIPVEFWREVVDRVAEEVPDTLLLAEAFWMMEGYFVRTLGMHRVYNSAFMNMLKQEENRKYRDTIKNTINFDPEILKRFVNFMNNPDEDTAIEQFGNGDKYIGVCTLLITMPGLPMFGHGQVEGYREKYGMEFSRAHWDELPDQHLIEAHYRHIFPLMKKRYLYSGVDNFALFDVRGPQGVIENIFAYSNGTENERSLVFYNNAYEQAGGWIRVSAPALMKAGSQDISDNRKLTETSLGSALNLIDADDRFAVLYGFHDNLTYLRPSSELYEKGLYIELSGYESQIFTGIHEVVDLDGTYALLCEHLDGRGVDDLEMALKRIRLHDIHTASEALFSKETISIMEHVLSGSKSAAQKLIETFKITAPYIAAAWERTKFISESPFDGSSYQFSPQHVAKRVDLILAATKRAANPETSLDRYFGNSLFIMPESAAIFCLYLFCSFITFPAESELLSSSNPDAALQDETLNFQDFSYFSPAEELLLSEVIHDRLYEAGLDLDTSGRKSFAVDIMLQNIRWFEDALISQASTKQLLEQFVNSNSFRVFSRINWHEGVEWYHKESMQDAFFWLTAAAVMNGLDSMNHDALYRTIMRFLKEEAGSAYRISSLLQG